jgi:hypothetical protein
MVMIGKDSKRKRKKERGRERERCGERMTE